MFVVLEHSAVNKNLLSNVDFTLFIHGILQEAQYLRSDLKLVNKV